MLCLLCFANKAKLLFSECTWRRWGNCLPLLILRFLLLNVFLLSSDVKLDIFNRGEVKSSANVMGVIRGSVEPGENKDIMSKSAFSHPGCIHSVATVRFLRVCRQICDLRQPQGQLGSRCHRPKQWDICHAGTVPSAWHEGQAGWERWWIYDRPIVLLIGRDKKWTCAPLCGREMETSKVHNLWKLGSWGVWPHWVGRIHRGSHSRLSG